MKALQVLCIALVFGGAVGVIMPGGPLDASGAALSAPDGADRGEKVALAAASSGWGEDLTLPRDVHVNVIEGLGWTAYQDLVASMDAALVLMDTPHPSYPPYDLASVGAAVLTNSHGIKTDLSDISDNIVVAPSTVDFDW